MPVIPALGRLRQNEHEFEASLEQNETLYQKNQNKDRKSVFVIDRIVGSSSEVTHKGKHP